MHKCKFDAQKIQKRRLKTQPVDSYLVVWVPLLLVGFIHYVAYVHGSSGPSFWILKIKQPSLPVSFSLFSL